MNALIIEDDPREQRFLSEGLTRLGYVCEVIGNGQTGCERLLARTYDLALVDIMLPQLEGTDLIRRVRREGVETPIIVVSALGTTADRVTGLNAGADDYLAKPCSLSELEARIAAIRRRTEGNTIRLLRADDLTIDTVARTCVRNGRSIELSKTEFALLECLLRNRGRILPESLLLEQAWGYAAEANPEIIPPHISRLKRKLTAGNEEFPIRHKRGLGYVFT